MQRDITYKKLELDKMLNISLKKTQPVYKDNLITQIKPDLGHAYTEYGGIEYLKRSKLSP